LYSSKTKILLIPLILILSLTTISAQSKKCYKCGKAITGAYLSVEGKEYHKQCFLCSACNKPISTKYDKHNGKFYHHDCYLEKFAEKCDICNELITGKYYVDVYGYKYHAKHEDEIIHCNNCYRIICENITKGGIKYKDGRNLCNLCYRNSANGQYEYDDILKYVLKNLDEMGVHIHSENIKIKSVNRNELKEIAGSNFVDRLKGYSRTKVTTSGGISEAEHTVYALSLIPRTHIESVVAHELMHVWLFQNTHDDHTPELKEGSCNYISYLYMKHESYSQEANFIIMLIDKNADPVYGDGFRKVKLKFQNRKLDDLLNYLKTHVSL
jgi:hypothetical protein